MLKIPLSTVDANELAEHHAKALLGLIKGRLNSRGNKWMKAYFSSDEKILDLLKAKPELLKKRNNEILNALKATGRTKDQVYKRAKQVFSYKYFFKKDGAVWSAFDLCHEIGLVTCPYCNLNFVNTIHGVKHRKLVLRPPLDHFLAFSRYPFVALSFYNLIPSCWTCNSSFKTQQDTGISTHLHPYLDVFGTHCTLDFRDYPTIDDIVLPGAKRFRVAFTNVTSDPRFKGNLKMFKLDMCYNEFKFIAQRTLLAAKKYDAATVSSIAKAVKGSEADTYRMIFHSEYQAGDHHLLPFSKANYDIVARYGSPELKSALAIP